MQLGLHQKKIDKENTQCLVCHHFCNLKDDQTGICGVRKNIGGDIYLLTYGYPAAINIDPVEKKPFFHFLPGSTALSFGTVGCNFRCGNCQNFGISQAKNFTPTSKKITPAQLVKLTQQNNCASIAYTYTEPTIFLEYALDTMKLAHEAGLKNVWVSNGYMSDKVLKSIIPFLDAINVDIKSLEEKFYQENCGARLEPILENCKKIAKEKIHLEVTTLIIPTLSDSPKNLENIARFIKEELGEATSWHVTRFSARLAWKLPDLPDTPVKTILTAQGIGHSIGLKNVYVGNI